MNSSARTNGFANEAGHYDATLGSEDMLVPWNDRVTEALLHNLATELPQFGGIICYEAVWDIKEDTTYRKLALTTVGEAARLWVNGEFCGSVVAKPYWFDLDGKLRRGENYLRIEVMSNLGYMERDKFSTYIPMPSIGLTGKIMVG